MKNPLNLIISRSTSNKLLTCLKKRQPSLQAPCNFNSFKYNFQISNDVILFDYTTKFKIPEEIVHTCYKKNIAYHINLSPQNTTTWPNAHVEDTNDKQMFAIFHPLVLVNGKQIFKLCEPNLEHESVGPILVISGMKMHVTSNYKTSLEFSKQLVFHAKVKPGHITLDLFFGLGYCSKEAIAFRASRVVSFEKYEQVVMLAKKNVHFSVNLDSPQLQLHCGVDVGKKKIFDYLKNYKFDSVIIDPPKSEVMLAVYSEEYLRQLAQFIKPGARVVTYVPEGTTKQYYKVLSNIIEIFESTNMYEFLYTEEKYIYVFKRI